MNSRNMIFTLLLLLYSLYCCCLSLNYVCYNTVKLMMASYQSCFTSIKCKVKYPATGRSGPRGSGQVKAPDHLDVRHYKGGWSSAVRTGRLYPRRNHWYSFSEAEWTSGHMVWSEGTTEKSPMTPPGIDLGTVRLVAQLLNHYATPGPLSKQGKV